MAKVTVTIEDIGEDASKVGRVRVMMESDPPIPGRLSMRRPLRSLP